MTKINLEDLSQIVVGASVMAVPIAFSEELWQFGETLPLFNILLLFAISLFILFSYTYFSIFQGNKEDIKEILLRVLISYTLTFLTVGLILYALNRLSFSEDIYIGLKRVIILCFPASFGAVIVDGFDKE